MVFHNNHSDTPPPSSPSVSITATPLLNSGPQQQQSPFSTPRKNTSQAITDELNNMIPTRDGKLECPRCGVLLASKGSMRNHLDKSHVPHGYSCKLCPCRFSGLAGVKSHLHSIHKGAPNVGDQYAVPGVEPDYEDYNNTTFYQSTSSSSSSRKNSYQVNFYVLYDIFKNCVVFWYLTLIRL